jgi:hypothetical protein
MSLQRSASRRAALVAVTPLVLVLAFAFHPYLPGRQPNVDALGDAVTADATRWGVVHLATGLGSALLAIAFLLVANHLSEAGENRWSGIGLPLVVVGCVLYAMLPAMELAPLAALESGGDPAAAQEQLIGWFLPVLLVSGITFGAGAVCLAVSVSRSRLLPTGATRLVVGALLVMALSRFVPLSAVQFYVQSLACYGALLPLAYSMWRPREGTLNLTGPRQSLTEISR